MSAVCAVVLLTVATAVAQETATDQPVRDAQSARAAAGAKATPSACVTCHRGLPEHLGQPVEAWDTDVHREAGLGCVDCHGGDPSPAMAEDLRSMDPETTDFRPAPDRLQIAESCAGCHSNAAYMKRFDPKARVDQLAEYLTSAHGIANAAGDPVPATCTDCHHAHGVRPVNSPDSPTYAANVPETCAHCHSDSAMMEPYALPVNVHEQYMGSVHADALLRRGDLAAPACNDCHGNHGAAPPGVASVANVCGQCHGRQASLFRASFKKELFDAMEVSECAGCHGHHLIRHPTPELFHGGSAPGVSAGQVVSSDPFVARLEELDAGGSWTASWLTVLRPHTEAGDEGLVHQVEVAAAGGEPLVVDATVRPGDALTGAAAVRRAGGGDLEAELALTAMAGSPVRAGDALRYRLEVRTAAPVTDLTVRDRHGDRIDPVLGSVCLECHSPGDACDQATERMYRALTALDQELREASTRLERAAHAGMEVSEAQFQLRSDGTTAAIESRALIHAFEPEQLLQRTEEGMTVAQAGLDAATRALDELQIRRRGLAVSLILVVLVVIGLYLKIRQVDRARDAVEEHPATP